MLIEIRSRFQAPHELWSGNRLVRRDLNRLVWVRGQPDLIHVGIPTHPSGDRYAVWVQIPAGNFTMDARSYWRLRFETRPDGLYYMLEYDGANTAIPWQPWIMSRMWTRERFTMYRYTDTGYDPLEGWWLDYRTLDTDRDILSLVDSRMARIQELQDKVTSYYNSEQVSYALQAIETETQLLRRELTLYRMGAPIQHA